MLIYLPSGRRELIINHNNCSRFLQIWLHLLLTVPVQCCMYLPWAQERTKVKVTVTWAGAGLYFSSSFCNSVIKCNYWPDRPASLFWGLLSRSWVLKTFSGGCEENTGNLWHRNNSNCKRWRIMCIGATPDSLWTVKSRSAFIVVSKQALRLACAVALRF